MAETTTEKKYISKAEVAKHNNRDDCWIIINGKVYDATKFLVDHPGGEDVILELAGDDATEGFDNVGHSEDAKRQLVGLLIGELDPADAKPTKQQRAAATTASTTSTAAAAAGGGNGGQKSSGGFMKLVAPLAIVALAYFAFQYYQQTTSAVQKH